MNDTIEACRKTAKACRDMAKVMGSQTRQATRTIELLSLTSVIRKRICVGQMTRPWLDLRPRSFHPSSARIATAKGLFEFRIKGITTGGFSAESLHFAGVVRVAG